MHFAHFINSFCDGKKNLSLLRPKESPNVLVALGELDSTLPDIEKLSDDFLEKIFVISPFILLS